MDQYEAFPSREVSPGGRGVSLNNKENASCVLQTMTPSVGFEIQSLADYLLNGAKRDENNSRKRKSQSSIASLELVRRKRLDRAVPRKSRRKLSKNPTVGNDNINKDKTLN